MIVRLLKLLILFGLYSCSSGKVNELDFIIIQKSSTPIKAWTRIEGIPKFDVNLHSDGCSGGMSAIY